MVLYARVSSDKQKQAGSLERQIAKLRQVVSQRETLAPESIPLFQDCASSFGERKALNALVDAMLDGKVRKVYVLYMDRLSRVPSTTSLLEHIARRCNVEIIALETENNDEEEDNFFISERQHYVVLCQGPRHRHGRFALGQLRGGTIGSDPRADGHTCCDETPTRND